MLRTDKTETHGHPLVASGAGVVAGKPPFAGTSATQGQSGKSARLAFIQLGLMAVVVAAFVANAVVDVRARRASAIESYDVAGHAMPSVDYLSRARGELREMRDDLRQAVAGIRTDGSASVDDLARDRADFEAALASYLKVQFFEGERELYAEVADSKALFERTADETLAGVRAGNEQEARSALDKAVQAADHLDAALERDVEFNADQGQHAARRMWMLGESRAARTLLVDVLLGLLAMAATVLAAVAWRRSLATLQMRSSELDQFAGRVAHDVLSPLMAVGLGLALSKARLTGDPAAVGTVDRSVRALERVRSLVTNLLEFARAGASPAGQTADVDEVLQGVMEGAQTEASAAGVELTAESSAELRVACAPGVLTSLTQNLLSNAIKYIDGGPARRVQVRVRPSGPYARFEVEDTGPGVPDEVAARVFEPFVRGTAAATGVGLGLATVKRLAESHHGRVGFQTRAGQGSVFWCELPRAPERPGGGQARGLRDESRSG